MIFEPDEFTQLQNAVRQIYKKDFLSNQEMVAQYNKSLGIKEESKRQFEEKKERDKSIGKVDVIDLETGNRELKNVIRQSSMMNLNLFDDDVSIKLAIDRGEIDCVRLINSCLASCSWPEATSSANRPSKTCSQN